MVQHVSSFLSLSSLFFSFFYLFYFFLISSQTSGAIFFFSSSCSMSLFLLFLVLTLPFLPAVLSGVFQTFGAGQEPPGLAHLSPPFISIESNTGTQSSVSSQQQLQEDELAAGWIHRLSNFLLILKLLQFAGFFIVNLSVQWCWILRL